MGRGGCESRGCGSRGCGSRGLWVKRVVGRGSEVEGVEGVMRVTSYWKVRIKCFHKSFHKRLNIVLGER